MILGLGVPDSGTVVLLRVAMAAAYSGCSGQGSVGVGSTFRLRYSSLVMSSPAPCQASCEISFACHSHRKFCDSQVLHKLHHRVHASKAPGFPPRGHHRLVVNRDLVAGFAVGGGPHLHRRYQDTPDGLLFFRRLVEICWFTILRAQSMD